jgi:hypothetical protein
VAAGAASAAGTAAGSVMHGLAAVSPAPDLPAVLMHQGNACRRRHGRIASVWGGRSHDLPKTAPAQESIRTPLSFSCEPPLRWFVFRSQSSPGVRN